MTNNLPFVTVITITKNLIKNGRKEFFKQCVESVYNQSYPNIEHLVIDGASDDGTLDLIKEYEDKGWIKSYSEKDAGIDDAYNNGLAKATGKYVAIMNSDDAYYSNEAIEISVKRLEEEKADYSYGKEKKIDQNGNFVMIWEPKVENFWKNMPFSHQTMLVKKEVMENLENYITNCGFGGDYHLVIQLILNDYKGVEIPEIISLYRLGGISSQTQDLKQQKQVYYVLAFRMLYIYKQFYDDIDLDECENIYHFGNNVNVYPKFFLQKLVRFMVEKDLKNFDYNTFITYINNISNSIPGIDYKKKSLDLFGLLPLLIIRNKGNKKIFRLFGFIPVLQIKQK